MNTFYVNSVQIWAGKVSDSEIAKMGGPTAAGLPAGVVPSSISAQPQSQTVTVGGSASFSVVATGTTPLTYQWQFNGANIPGATASTLTLNNVQASNAGKYTAIVSNSGASVKSQEAVLTVNPSPTSTLQFHPADANKDSSLSLGEVLSYAAAFKKGADWPVDPNPIPLGYVIRGFTLYKTGERYKFDATAGSAPASWVSDAAKP